MEIIREPTQLKEPRTGKGQQTKAKLLRTALAAFAEDGYQAASMRAIANRAGVSLSHAYYYFHSKEDIVLELLLSLRAEQYALCNGQLDDGNTLEANIHTVFNSNLQVMEKYHDFGPAFLKVLLSRDPENSELAQLEMSLWERAVAGARPLPPLGIRRELPRFLWLLSRQVFSAWAYDSSPDQRRSRALMRNVAPVVGKFAILCRLPVVRSLFEDVLALMDSSGDQNAERGSTATGTSRQANITKAKAS
ncbi:hypothetical protein CQ010_10445 [Arthrobacter sp. MYb211]|uniref:TetR/AcrR family transcriptional regulator n=1 Tax=unclassified Arthrobacter TaxID=235627 RepID=UPI000CFCF936|nr:MULTISPECIES: TetR/AcrR family transcriptional regulator [unclassified Arthrobacter]PRA10991.1 hypothetical protein CQ015_11155 [Arthrobacter sp. MYb221]PRC07145.1 hypothetical protein CQ010_10445 [Arthrobacter sp. MYb211]